MKKKMLYIMHIDWNWIKQRPQFLAEELSRYYDLTVVYTYGYNRHLIKQTNKHSGFKKIIPLFRLPSSKLRNTFFGELINNFLLKIQFFIIGKDFDYVWLMSPDYVDVLRELFKTTTVIYDCMDDYVGLLETQNEKLKMLEKEKKLLEKTNIVFASSINLQQTIKNRGYKGKCYLLYNGISDKLLKNDIRNNYFNESQQLKLLYIGTIAHWFDFEKILELLDDFTNISISLVGPCATKIPKHDRLIYKGIIEHDSLSTFVANYDVLIMPFIVNELILSVDPVKIYEYISFGKNIIAVYYPEMYKFRDFVLFYQSYDELKEQVVKLLVNNKSYYSKDQARKFLQSNTWKIRADDVHKIINSFGSEYHKTACM